MRPILPLPFLALLGIAAAACPRVAAAATPPLLEQAVENWVASKSDWAVTQETKTFHGDGTVKEDRVERFDPGLPDDSRWHLLSLNGHPATAEERAHWEHRRNSRPRKPTNKSPRDYLDFENAVQVGQTPKIARFAVALKPEALRLVQVDKLEVEITVDKASKSIERVTAVLSEPMNVAFGLAKVTDIELDVRFDNPPGSNPNPPATEPRGTGKATLTKFGDRAEYTWSDFTRLDRPAK